MSSFDEFDEQTDFSFLALEESAPVAVTPKKSRSVQTDKISIGIKLTFTFSDEHKANLSKALKGIRRSDEFKARARQTLAGRKQSAESVAKRTATNRALAANGHQFGKKKPKPMMTPAGIFPSRKSAAEFFDIRPGTMGVWMTECPQQFYYITKD